MTEINNMAAAPMAGVSDAVRGLWEAVLVHGGDVLDPSDLVDATSIAVVRDTALPVQHADGLCRPRRAQATDLLYEADLYGEEPDVVRERWEQAKAVAAALNAASGEAS